MTARVAPRPIELTVEQEAHFWSGVRKTSSCWLWTREIHPRGYGTFRVGTTALLAHRVAYRITNGPIPPSEVLDHICRVRQCVNPAHLRPVSNKDNILLGVSPTAINARKTHCVRGHELTPANTYAPPSRPNSRLCRACAQRRWTCPYCGDELNHRHRRRHVANRHSAEDQP